MSGHSKWAQIKRKKATTDARRGKLWTRLVKEITVASRLGGGDPDHNPRLRAAVQDAKTSNVPAGNIDRAIKRGSGELEGAAYEEITYEGYAPGGGALLIEAITDNRNRTVAELRHLFSRSGGNLGESGCVAWMFQTRGYIAFERSALGEEALLELALELEVDDVSTEDAEVLELFTSPEDFERVREAIAGRGLTPVAAELEKVAASQVELDSRQAAQAARLLEAIEDHDDVQDVWANFDLDTADSLVPAE
jgi:YebC/PmpR family DNA-binding regulatory protein